MAQKDLAEALAALGRAELALKSMRDAVATRRSLTRKQEKEDNVISLSNFLNTLGSIERQFGHYDESIKAFTENTEIHLAEADVNHYALALSEVAYTYNATGNTRKAAEYLSRAIQTEEANNAIRHAPRWRLQLDRMSRGRFPGSGRLPTRVANRPSAKKISDSSSAYTEAERASEWVLDADGGAEIAADILRRALEWAMTNNDTHLQIVCINSLAVALNTLEHRAESISLLRRGIQLADGAGGADSSLQLRYNLAKFLAIGQDYSQAFDVLVGGIGYSEIQIEKTKSFALRQQVIAGALSLHELFVNIVGHSPNVQSHRLVMRDTELVRSRTLGSWARSQAAVEHASRAPTLSNLERKQLSSTLEEIRSAEVELDMRHHAGQLSAERSSTLLDTIKRSTDVIREQLNLPEERPLLDVSRPLLGNIENVTVLSLFCIPEGVVASVCHCTHGQEIIDGTFIDLTDDGRAPIVQATSIATSSGRAESGFLRRLATGESQPLVSEAKVDTVPSTVLMDHLIDLLAKHNPIRLVIVPHRELSVLPYWALKDALPTCEEFIFAPSIAIFDLCHSRVRATAGDTCLVGDQTQSLPLAAREIARVMKARSGKAAFATTAAEVIAAGETCNLLHVAAHGLFDESNPYLSGIILEKDNLPSDGLCDRYVEVSLNSGRLSVTFLDEPTRRSFRLMTVADTITKLSLSQCRLAVLSACEAGLASTYESGELLGLPNSFLVAGAKSVIAPLWPVDDTAAAVLMSLFYAEWTGGTGRHDAVARALSVARARLKALTRPEIVALVGERRSIPQEEYPFAASRYADAFHCFGSW